MFLGIDLGTSSLKALVLDVDGTIVGTGSASYVMSTPQPGWAESDPQGWWDAAATAVHEAAGEHASEIASERQQASDCEGDLHLPATLSVMQIVRCRVTQARGRGHRQVSAVRLVGSEACL